MLVREGVQVTALAAAMVMLMAALFLAAPVLVEARAALDAVTVAIGGA
jgi:hypothetical protein